jgi:RNA polymerase sigma-70 factor (ECF subfamily)
MSDVETERRLVAAAMGGDVLALEQLLCAHLTPLERYIDPKIPPDIRRHVGTDDVLQEILAQAFRNIHRYEHRGDSGFLAWLKAIADHRLTDILKRLRRKKRGGDHNRLSKADMAGPTSSANLIDQVCQDNHLPDDSAARREAEKAIQVALAGLPADQRDAIRANLLEGKSIEEVAQQMGRTADAVRGLVHRGKKKLAEAMGRSSQWFTKR